MLLTNEMELFHGTSFEIIHVDVTKGRSYKDFGRGFYMAVSKTQAIGMMHKKYREALRRNYRKGNVDIGEYLYRILIDWEYLDQLKVKRFEAANEEWLDFVLMCREKGGLPHDYDVVIGPTADDNTMFCLKAYWDGLYGKVGSLSAKKILLSNLEPENLGIQVFVGRQDVADRLILEMRPVDWR